MADPIPENVFVMLCDWRGHVVWDSRPDGHVKVGELAWLHLEPHSQEIAREMHSKVAALREMQTFQVETNTGKCLRCWMWPLDSPEVAVCALLREVPTALRALTEREVECLELLAQGMETKDVAERLELSLSTVHTHLKRAHEKLGLPGMESLISFAARYCYPRVVSFQKEGTTTAGSNSQPAAHQTSHEG